MLRLVQASDPVPFRSLGKADTRSEKAPDRTLDTPRLSVALAGANACTAPAA
jgi:hypothetical protein